MIGYSAAVLAPPDAPAEETVLTVPIPEHTTYVEGSLRGLDGVAAEVAGSTLRIPLGSLSAGDRLGLAWDVRIDPELPDSVGAIVARATVEAQGLSRHPSDGGQHPTHSGTFSRHSNGVRVPRTSVTTC